MLFICGHRVLESSRSPVDSTNLLCSPTRMVFFQRPAWSRTLLSVLFYALLSFGLKQIHVPQSLYAGKTDWSCLAIIHHHCTQVILPAYSQTKVRQIDAWMLATLSCVVGRHRVTCAGRGVGPGREGPAAQSITGAARPRGQGPPFVMFRSRTLSLRRRRRPALPPLRRLAASSAFIMYRP